MKEYWIWDIDRTLYDSQGDEDLLSKKHKGLATKNKDFIYGGYCCTRRRLTVLKRFYENAFERLDLIPDKKIDKRNVYCYKVIENLNIFLKTLDKKFEAKLSTPDDFDGNCGSAFSLIKKYEEGYCKDDELVKKGNLKEEIINKNPQLLQIAQDILKDPELKEDEPVVLRFFDDESELCSEALHAPDQPGWPSRVKLEIYLCPYDEHFTQHPDFNYVYKYHEDGKSFVKISYDSILAHIDSEKSDLEDVELESEGEEADDLQSPEPRPFVSQPLFMEFELEELERELEQELKASELSEVPIPTIEGVPIQTDARDAKESNLQVWSTFSGSAPPLNFPPLTEKTLEDILIQLTSVPKRKF